MPQAVSHSSLLVDQQAHELRHGQGAVGVVVNRHADETAQSRPGVS
jgi:hypothetical protein